jgi:hypothetical protein
MGDDVLSPSNSQDHLKGKIVDVSANIVQDPHRIIFNLATLRSWSSSGALIPLKAGPNRGTELHGDSAWRLPSIKMPLI